eukprot:42913_1
MSALTAAKPTCTKRIELLSVMAKELTALTDEWWVKKYAADYKNHGKPGFADALKAYNEVEARLKTFITGKKELLQEAVAENIITIVSKLGDFLQGEPFLAEYGWKVSKKDFGSASEAPKPSDENIIKSLTQYWKIYKTASLNEKSAMSEKPKIPTKVGKWREQKNMIYEISKCFISQHEKTITSLVQDGTITFYSGAGRMLYNARFVGKKSDFTKLGTEKVARVDYFNEYNDEYKMDQSSYFMDNFDYSGGYYYDSYHQNHFGVLEPINKNNDYVMIVFVCILTAVIILSFCFGGLVGMILGYVVSNKHAEVNKYESMDEPR